MNAADFRRIALSLEGAEEGSHMGVGRLSAWAVEFFAALASQKQAYGRPMLTPEMQADFVAEQPEVFPARRWGLGTHGGDATFGLARANEDVLAGALRAAW